VVSQNWQKYFLNIDPSMYFKNVTFSQGMYVFANEAKHFLKTAKDEKYFLAVPDIFGRKKDLF
jgi:hypothetical protein